MGNNGLKGSGDCYAPGEVLGSSRETGQQSGTSLFGTLGAEKAIEHDYVGETNPILAGAAMAIVSETDWFDTGKKADFIEILVKRHKHLKKSELESDRFQWPDILTLNGVSFAWNFQALVRGRNEFYEIKPDSPTGETASEEKLKNIRGMFKRYQLLTIYKPGEFYPRLNPKEIDIPKNRFFVWAVRAFMRQTGIQRVRVYLSLRRPKAGVLLYKLCIEIQTEDQRKQQALAKAAAKHLFAAYVVCHAPERFNDIAKQLGDYSFQGEKFPRVHCEFNALNTLSPYKNSIEQAINMRGLGLPGEEYLLCCDEHFYRTVLAPRTPDIIGELWARLLQGAKPWVLYAAGSTGWQKLQPIILAAEEAGKKIREMYPELVEFANQVLAWIKDHPYLSVAIVVTAFVLTASVVGLVEAGIIGAGASLVAAETITESSALPVIGSMGRVAATEAVATQMFTSEVAAGSAVRGLMSAEQVAAQIGGTAAAANDTAFVASALAQNGLRVAAAQTAEMRAAAFLLMANCNTAYVQQSTTDVPSPKNQVIAQGVSKLFMVRAREIPSAGSRRPGNGNVINLHEHAAAPQGFANPFQPEDPIWVRLAGRVRLS